MRFLGIYFTGTGNSKRVMDVINHNLISLQHTLDTVDVIKDEIKDINEYDGLIITYPIYGFNAPKPIISYVKKMVKANENKPCLIMKQSENIYFGIMPLAYISLLY